MLSGQVMALAAVGIDMEELPAVGVEVPPPRGGGRVHGVGEPALVPDTARPEHGVELGLLAGLGSRIIQCGFETHPFERLLRDRLHGLRWGDAQQVIHGRGDIADVDVVVTELAVCANSLGPGDDRGIGDATLVGGVALVELVGRVERHRPADRVVVVGLRAAEFVVAPHAVLDGVDEAVEELDFVDRPVGSALAAGAVVGDHHDDCVVQLTGILQIVQDPADLGIGVGQEAGEHLGHPGEEALLLVGQSVPGPHGVLQRPRFPVGALDIQIRIDLRQFGVGRYHAELLLVGQHDLAVALVAHVEAAGVFVGPLLEHMVRGVTGAGAEVGEPRLVRRDHLGVLDELDRLVGEVLRQVIALFRGGGRLDGVVVVDQFRIPLVGLAAEESVEPLEAPRQRPMPFGGGQAGLLQWGHVPLAEAVGVVSALGEHFGDQRGVIGDAAVDTGKALGELLHDGHAHGCGVATGQQRRPGRRAQRGGVELGQPHTTLGDPAHGGHVDQAAEAVPGGDPDVVPDEVEHIGCVRRSFRRLIRAPVRFGVTDVEGDLAGELSSHDGDVTDSVSFRSGLTAQNAGDPGEPEPTGRENRQLAFG